MKSSAERHEEYKPRMSLVGVVPEKAGGPPPEDLPEVKASSELKIGTFTLKCHVLIDGRRIIEKKSFDKFLNYLMSGGSITPADEKKVATFVEGL